LLYQGKESGYFAQYRPGVLSIGTFDRAIENIGDASFNVVGKKPFKTAKEAVIFLVARANIRLASHSVRELIKKGLL
jgi:hypothetical protein